MGQQKSGVLKDCSESEGFCKLEVLYIVDEKETVSQNDLLLLSREKVVDNLSYVV